MVSKPSIGFLLTAQLNGKWARSVALAENCRGSAAHGEAYRVGYSRAFPWKTVFAAAHAALCAGPFGSHQSQASQGVHQHIGQGGEVEAKLVGSKRLGAESVAE